MVRANARAAATRRRAARRVPRLGGAPVALAALLGAGGAFAAPDAASASTLERARAAIEDLRYDDAVAILRDHAAPTARERARRLELLAVAHLLAGRADEGERATRELYELAPGFALDDPSLPPRVTTVFATEARRPHARGATLTVRPDSGDASGFVVASERPIDAVEVACAAGSSSYAPVGIAASPAGFRFRLPTLVGGASLHRCRAVAFDADGLPIGRLGSSDAPIELRPRAIREAPAPAASPRPFASPWFWVGVGAAVVAAGAVVVIATRPADAALPAAEATVDSRPVSVAW